MCDDEFCHCDCHDYDEPEARVKAWVERQKMLGRLTPSDVAVFERCIEDMEAGDV